MSMGLHLRAQLLLAVQRRLLDPDPSEDAAPTMPSRRVIHTIGVMEMYLLPLLQILALKIGKRTRSNSNMAFRVIFPPCTSVRRN